MRLFIQRENRGYVSWVAGDVLVFGPFMENVFECHIFVKVLVYLYLLDRQTSTQIIHIHIILPFIISVC